MKYRCTGFERLSFNNRDLSFKKHNSFLSAQAYLFFRNKKLKEVKFISIMCDLNYNYYDYLSIIDVAQSINYNYLNKNLYWYRVERAPQSNNMIDVKECYHRNDEFPWCYQYINSIYYHLTKNQKYFKDNLDEDWLYNVPIDKLTKAPNINNDELKDVIRSKLL